MFLSVRRVSCLLLQFAIDASELIVYTLQTYNDVIIIVDDVCALVDKHIMLL